MWERRQKDRRAFTVAAAAAAGSLREKCTDRTPSRKTALHDSDRNVI